MSDDKIIEVKFDDRLERLRKIKRWLRDDLDSDTVPKDASTELEQVIADLEDVAQYLRQVVGIDRTTNPPEWLIENASDLLEQLGG